LVDSILKNENFNVTIYFSIQWSYKYILEKSMDQSNKIYAEMGVDTGEDSLKQMILQTDLWLFVLTGIVSVLHSLFEFLAIKNEV
jgi:uncharacterized membrane protein